MNNTQKWLTKLVILLAIINVSLLGIMWRVHLSPRKQPPTPHQRNIRPELTGRMLIKDLELNRAQRHQFRVIFKKHRATMDSLNNHLRQIKNETNKAILSNDTAKLAKTNQELFFIQNELELETQKLTRMLAGIITDDQKQKFLNALQQALIHPPKRKRNGKN